MYNHVKNCTVHLPKSYFYTADSSDVDDGIQDGMFKVAMCKSGFFLLLFSQDNSPKWMQHMLNVHFVTIPHHVNATAFDLSLKIQTSNQIARVSVTFVQQ